jgi:tetratricopeptide (TPR) repeat protein
MLWLSFGGGLWAISTVCVGAGSLAFYWGVKVCPLSNRDADLNPDGAHHNKSNDTNDPLKRTPKRAMVAIAAGGYFLSISANFVAGAVAGSTSYEASYAAIRGDLNTLLPIAQETEKATQRIEHKLDKHRDDISEIRRMAAEEISRPKTQELLSQTTDDLITKDPDEIRRYVDIYSEIIEIPNAPHDILGTVLIKRAIHYGNLGRPEAGIEDLTSAIALRGIQIEERVRALDIRAGFMSECGKYDEAIQDCSRILEMPDTGRRDSALWKRCDLLFIQGDTAGACEDLDQLIRDYEHIEDWAGLRSLMIDMANRRKREYGCP